MSWISNAKIQSVQTPPLLYADEPEPRGSPKFRVRAHVLAEILRNPQRWRLGYESPESKSKKFGSLLDCVALTPRQWFARYCCTPETYINKDGEEKPWRNDRRIKAIDEWWKDHEGREEVSAEENGAAHAALKRLQADERIAEFLGSGQTQVWISGEYHDPDTGLVIPTKCLVDVLPAGDHPIFAEMLGDLKTTRNASPRQFARDCNLYRYHLQAAWYLDHVNAALGEARHTFVHVVVESFPPFECRMPILSQAFLDFGRYLYQQALVGYCRFLSENKWPSYDKLGAEWPMTSPEDWMIAPEALYGDPRFAPAEVEPEDEGEEEPSSDLIP